MKNWPCIHLDQFPIRFGEGQDPFEDWLRFEEHMRRHRATRLLHIAYRRRR